MKIINLTLASFLLVAPAIAATAAEDFDNIDANHDGVLTPSEMATAQRASLDTQNDNIMNLLDKNKDDRVSQEEYMAFYTKLASSEEEVKQVENQFKNLDKDNSGDISADELGSYREGSLDKETEEFFTAVDTNKDGQVSREEYSAFVDGLKGLFEAFGSDYIK